MKTLVIWFDSFWGLFDKYDNLFTWVLSQKYNVIVREETPDIIFTVSVDYHKKGNEIAVNYSGEPLFNISNCDFALTSFYIDDPRFFRLPLYTLYAYDLWKHNLSKSYNAILTRNYSPDILKEKNKKFTYISQGRGGSNCPRESLINFLKEHIPIDCAGSHLNNHTIVPGEPGTVFGSMNKINFLKNYKFAFAIENNDSYNGYFGYTTEKIFEPMVANCIPIYWGNKDIANDFNPDSFINVKDYDSYEKLLERLIAIDSNEDLYIDYLMQPYVLNNNYFDLDYLVELFDCIIKV